MWFGISGIHFEEEDNIHQILISWFSQFKSGVISSDEIIKRVTAAWDLWKEGCSKVFEDKLLSPQIYISFHVSLAATETLFVIIARLIIY